MSKTEKKDADEAKIAAAEASLVAKYGKKIVKGSVRRAKTAEEKAKYKNKLLVDINTVGLDGKPDSKTRTVATSDVFQIHHQPEVKAELVKAQRSEKAKAKRAAKAPKKDETPDETPDERKARLAAAGK
jgi:hypothetical protein